MTDRSFGTELRRLRESSGMSLADLAERVFYNKGYLSRVETGRRNPSVLLARACDDALGAKGQLASLAVEPSIAMAEQSYRKMSKSRRKPWNNNDRAMVPVLASDGGLTLVPMERGDFLSAATTTKAVSMQSEPLTMSDHPTAEMVQALAKSLDHYVVASRSIRAQDMVQILSNQVALIDRLLRGSSVRLRPTLLRVGARYCEFLGRMSQETGDRAQAWYWTDRASEWGQIAGYHSMIAYSLTRKARLVWSEGNDSRRVIDLARAALQVQGLTPRIKAQALLQEASGHAQAGDYGLCRRTLDEARKELTAVDRSAGDQGDNSEPALGPQGSGAANRVNMALASCLVDLDRPAEAIEIYAKEISQIPSTSQRGITQHTSRLAVAYARAGEAEQACVIGDRALEGQAVVESATTREELLRLQQSLRSWLSHPPVREFNNRLSAAIA